jgi:predicted transcriptional regulator
VEYEVSEYREVSEKAIIERIQQLEKQLGYVRQIESTGTIGKA